MKIVCPECSASFDVPVPLMGTGRRVRCNNCGHIWMQEPVSEPAGFGGFRSMDTVNDIDPIPASVHPGEDDDRDHGDSGPGFFADIKWGALARMTFGFLLGAGLIAGVALGLASMHMLPHALMPLAVAAGATPPANLEGLQMIDVSAKTEADATLVSGSLVNSGLETHAMPGIEIVPIAGDGTEGERTLLKLEQSEIKPGETFPFRAQMPGAFDQAKLRLRFIP